MRAWDWHANEIQARGGRRDQIDNDADSITVYLSNGAPGSQFFRISAGGVLADGWYWRNSGVHDFSADFQFEGAARVDEDGWSMELKIPLSELRMGKRPWHLVVVRHLLRERRWTLQSVPLSNNPHCLLCPQNLPPQAVFWPHPALLQVQASNDLPALGLDLQPNQDVQLQASFRPPSGNIDPAVHLNPAQPFARRREEERQFFTQVAQWLPQTSELQGETAPPVGVPVYTPAIS